MATKQPDLPFSLPAAADLSAATNLYRLVTINNVGKIALSAAHARVVGVLQNQPKANEMANFDGRGIEKVQAGAAIVAGADLASDATGRAVTAVSGDEIFGTAVGAAAAAGVILQVVWQPRGVKP